MSEQPATAVELPPLETPCQECEGRGWDAWAGGSSTCSACYGTGIAPTEAGKRILDLMRRHFRAMLKDEL